MTPLSEKQYTDLKRFYTRVRLKWNETQPQDRYSTALQNANNFFASGEMDLQKAKVVYLHLKSLATWLKNMENYDWEFASN